MPFSSQRRRARAALRGLLALAPLLVLAPLANASPAVSPGTGTVAAAAAPPAPDASAFGTPINLTSGWRFTVGDNAAWAMSAYNDAAWQPIALGHNLSGIPRFSACWYRIRVRIHPETPQVAVGIKNITGSYEVYVNGQRIGSYGTIPARSHAFEAPIHTYIIPTALYQHTGGSLVIALRFSVAPPDMVARGVVTPLGEDSRVSLTTPAQAAHDSSYEFAHTELFNLGSAVLYFLCGLFVLGLYSNVRQQQEYVALGVCAMSASAYVGLEVFLDARYADHSHLGSFFALFIWAIQSVSNFEFIRLLVRKRRSWVILSIQAATIFNVFFDQVYILGGPYATAALVSHLLVFLAGDAYVLISLLGAWRRDIDVRIIFPVWFVSSMTDVYTLAGIGLRLGHAPVQLPAIPDIPIGSYRLPVLIAINLVYVIALFTMVLLRTNRIAQERAAVAGEVAAAQTVEQVLLARASHPTPGFVVQSVYQPASEVGGDFFFVQPGPDDSLTAVVGDVSGKGLLAAMRVSMILGVLLREQSREPSEILASLNEVLLLQGEMGFTTACCVRLDREGHYAIANAGHISPYVSGREVVAPPSLPLGMVGGQEYETLYGQLNQGETLVLLSDGIVEARSSTGELYGFERAAALTLRPAEEIARTAIGFGQEDDITVLTIACACIA